MSTGAGSVTILGASQAEVCGVRDYAAILADELTRLGHQVHVSWSGPGERHRRPVTGLLRAAQRAASADVVVVNYSVFASAWHGIPLGIPVLALILWRANRPTVIVAHELAYPWGRRGWRGFLYALTQRLVLVPLVAACDVIVVTTEQRLDWVISRRWLPTRPVRWVPVFNNLPVVTSARTWRRAARVGVFGYGSETDRRRLVVEGVARVASRVTGTELVLLGMPGPTSPQGRAWREAAEAAACPIRFTGVLPAPGLSESLTELTVLLFFDDAGPTSRKGTLAAALAHGVPTVALDGPDRWTDLLDAGAVELVPPRVEALSDAIIGLITDPDRRQRLGQAGRSFYQERMSARTVAGRVEEAIRAAMARQEVR